MDRLFHRCVFVKTGDYVSGDLCGSLLEFPCDSTAAVDSQRYNKGTTRPGKYQKNYACTRNSIQDFYYVLSGVATGLKSKPFFINFKLVAT